MRMKDLKTPPNTRPAPSGAVPRPRRKFLETGIWAGVTILVSGCASPQRTGAKKLLEAIAKSNRRQSIAMKQFTDIVSSRLQDLSLIHI